MVDKLVVKQRLAMIGGFLQQLERLRKLPKNTFLNPINSAAAESYIRRSLEAVFDIGRHILARTGGIEMAQEYKSIAYGLGTRKIVSKEIANKLVKMAGYRNRMVHLYHQVTDEELHRIVQDDLKDFYGFMEEIQSFLNRQEFSGC